MLSRKKSKLCIIGSAPSKADAPYADKDFDIWAISGAVFSDSLDGIRKPDTEDNSWNSVSRVDVIFEMHKRPLFIPKLERLAACNRPVIMQRTERDIPTSQIYPADEIAEKIGEDFSSSIAYMLAYALYLGYSEIRLYGIVLMHDTEYVRQRPGVKYYLGIARALGVKVWAPDNVQLTIPGWRYGYDDQDTICALIAARKKSLDDDIEKQKKIIEDARSAFFQLRGASIDCSEIMMEIKGGLV